MVIHINEKDFTFTKKSVHLNNINGLQNPITTTSTKGEAT
jgi:hypothetical protein